MNKSTIVPDYEYLRALCDRMILLYTTLSISRSKAKWWTRAKELCEYAITNKSPYVAQSLTSPLSIWVATQRQSAKNNKFSNNDSKLLFLNFIGLLIDGREIQQLRLFESIKIALESNRTLTNAERCSIQRIRSKWAKNELSDSLIEKYESIGFEWSNRRTTYAKLLKECNSLILTTEF